MITIKREQLQGVITSSSYQLIQENVSNKIGARLGTEFDIFLCHSTSDFEEIEALKAYFLTKGKNFEYEIILKMVCNADKVNNICADVIGDMCGILSGACGATIVAKADNLSYNYINAICVSSLIVAITVGGKAYMKDIAIHSSEEYLISCIKLLKIFIRKKDGNYRKNKFSKRFKKS